MPIHDLGYRGWNGRRSTEFWRWLVIAQNGFLRAWNSRWLRRLMILAWIPATYFGVAFFAYERALTSVENRGLLEVMAQLMPENLSEAFQRATEGDPTETRHYVWSQLLFVFFRYSQSLLMVLVVGLVAPPLIARDVASKAFLVYFSRPISRLEYILGKSATVWGYLLLISTAPALALYALAVALSPSIEVVGYTWDVPLRVLVASGILLIPTTAVALALSSLSRRVMTAGFLWYAVWVLGGMANRILTGIDRRRAAYGEEIDPHRWAPLSLYEMLGLAQGYVFDPDSGSTMVGWSAGLLAAITVVSLLVTYWRVSSPMRV